MRFYNTLTRRKDEFVPLHPGKVGMYVCGPTVYGYTHIGNLRAFVFADTLRRVLEEAGYEVRLIKNITDVGHLTADDVAQGDSGEDKIEKKARAEHKTPAEIAEFYETYFHATERSLNIEPAQYFPRATTHIPQMIKMIETLIAKGHAYEKNGNVFYDVTSFPGYGKLSGNTLEHLRVGARLEEHPDKRHPWDFALWLQAPAGHLMHWPSPWGEGYPGWHIECSAMSLEYLGDTFDIHTGGEDHIFPHHEAEIAQSESVTGQPFARFFLHERHILVDGQKMSKSEGNFYILEDITRRGFSPLDFRMLLLGTHYRNQMNFSWESLDQARKNKETLFGAVERLTTGKTVGGFDGSEYLVRFREALRDDLNTPLALAVALELATAVNTALDASAPLDVKKLQAVFATIYALFGLTLETETIPENIAALARAAEQAREGKDYAEADRLKADILAQGYGVEFRKGAVRVRKTVAPITPSGTER